MNVRARAGINAYHLRKTYNSFLTVFVRRAVVILLSDGAHARCLNRTEQPRKIRGHLSPSLAANIHPHHADHRAEVWKE